MVKFRKGAGKYSEKFKENMGTSIPSLPLPLSGRPSLPPIWSHFLNIL